MALGVQKTLFGPQAFSKHCVVTSVVTFLSKYYDTLHNIVLFTEHIQINRSDLYQLGYYPYQVIKEQSAYWPKEPIELPLHGGPMSMTPFGMVW